MNRNSLRVYGLTCVLLLLASFAAHATTIVLPTDEQLIAKAPVIVDGTVLSSQAVEADGKVWTETVVAVARTIKGRAADTITIRELGGQTTDRVTKIYGTPEFAEKERVLLFLEAHPRGGYRTVDLFVGKFTEGATQNGRRLWLRDDAGVDATLLDENFRPLTPGNIQRDAANFENFVYARVAGLPGMKNYGVENPVLATGEEPRDRLQSDFTLISEPTRYRWFRFDSGQTAQWYSSGSQPGYSDGGVAELRTGMNSWTSYSSANINYSYSGTRSGSLGGLDGPNGVNEVLFNDPLNEISGTYSRSTGGVVGTGGFNGVSGQQTWTAPFAADSSHPAGNLSAWTITEGNLTIQDGVTPANGISSSILAEIIAHEFGHTLGFGHSADGTALMYYSVTGRGPSLRSDDQTAARWLYPNGSTPPPTVSTPAAPTNLTASVSGNDVTLTWTDNASNETGYRVYVDSANVSSLGANTTSTTRSDLAAGAHTFYVSAYNSAGSANSNSISATIAATAPPPVAAFDASATSGTTQTAFTFYDRSTGTVASRQWSFGDGGTSTAATAQHVYAAAGTYTVTLKVTGAGVTSQASKNITVSNPPPVTPAVSAAFEFSPAAPSVNTNVTFSDRSSGAPTKWQWSFGDGQNSTAQNPVHAYAAPGTYTVTLTASNASSSATATKQVTVTSVTMPFRSLV
ncbi:MAG: PKD domain-containing protein, partial [Thermoanaerobaculia bacterium]